MSLTAGNQITEYEPFAREVAAAHYTPGVLTNNFLSEGELRKAIANGTLYAHMWSGGLLIFQERASFCKLNFDITDASIPPEIDFPKPCLTEIVLRPTDKRIQQAVEFFKAVGFETYIRRQRWERKGNPPISPGTYRGDVFLCRESDAAAVLDLLKASFDKYSGCIPTLDELRNDIRAGNVYAAYEDGAVIGFLHVRKAEKPYSEMRHLAVSEAARGKNVAQKLLYQYITDENAVMRKSWVPEHNDASKHLHKKNGFTLDGWMSEVLILK